MLVLLVFSVLFIGVTVLEVLKSIEKDTNLAFFYNNADVDVTRKVSEGGHLVDFEDRGRGPCAK